MKLWLKGLIVSAFAVLAPIHAIMAVAGILIFTDLILGIIAARKRGEKITSAALRRTVSKMLIYQSALITGFLVEHYMVSDVVPIAKLVAGAIGMVEIKSILENLDTINGSPIFAAIVKKIGSQNDK